MKRFNLFLFTFMLVSGASLALSQWVQTTGPYGGRINALGAFSDGSGGTILLAGGPYGGGVHRSTNNGAGWTRTGLVNAFTVASFPGSGGGTNILAGTSNGVSLSTDNGSTWTTVNTGYPSGSLDIDAFTYLHPKNGPTMVFAGRWEGGAYVSTDDGATWSAADSGISTQRVQSLSALDSTLFAGTLAGGIFRSTDRGRSWAPINNGLTNLDVRALAVAGSNVLAGTQNGVHLSTDHGSSWTPVNTGLTLPSGLLISSLAVFGAGDTNLLAGTLGGGIFLSTNNGTNWTPVSTGLTNDEVLALAAIPDGAGGTNLFAGTNGDGVFLSMTKGTSWTPVNEGLALINVNALGVFPEGSPNLFVATWGGVFLSTDDGGSWKAVDSGMTENYVYTLAGSGSDLFAGTTGGVFRSTDNGTSWAPANSGLTAKNVLSLAIVGAGIFAGTDDGVFLSMNSGSTWVHLNAGLPPNSPVQCLASWGTDVYAGVQQSGVILSTDGGVSWNPLNAGLPANMHAFALAFDGTNMFAGTFADTFAVYRYAGQGATWSEASSGLPPGTAVYTFALSDTNMFAGANVGIFLSANEGAQWTRVDDGSVYNINALVASHGYLFAGGWGGLGTTPRLGKETPGAHPLDIGTGGTFGIWKRPLAQMITGIGAAGETPGTFALSQNFPNPFNPTTAISYQLPAVSRVSLRVYDILGRQVATLAEGIEQAGPYTVTFHASGLASGTYFARFTARDERGSVRYAKVLKLMLLK